jgi:integrase/recombinase XerD
VPNDCRALIDQLRAHLTQQRYNPVVVHNQCRGAEHFVECLTRRNVAVDSATPDHVASYINYALRRFRRRHGHPAAPRWQAIPRAGIHALLRLVQKRWPSHPEAVGKQALIESHYVHFVLAAHAGHQTRS